MSDISTRLDQIEHLTGEIVRLPVPEDETADAMGRTRKIETALAGWRRGMLAETPGGTVGKAYKVKESRKAVRSYSTAPILSSLLAKHDELSMLDGLQLLLTSGAAKLTYQWSKLEALFAKEDIELRTVGHEIEDDGDPDGPHVGAVWTTTTSVVGKETG